MKKIPLKDIEYDSPDFMQPGVFARTDDGDIKMVKRRLNYRFEFKTLVLSTPLSQGITVDDMRKANRILDTLDKSVTNGAIFLDDMDWQYLCRVVEGGRYMMPNRGVIQMVDDLKNAPEGKPEAHDEPAVAK